jgi:hypothetical protein
MSAADATRAGPQDATPEDAIAAARALPVVQPGEVRAVDLPEITDEEIRFVVERALGMPRYDPVKEEHAEIVRCSILWARGELKDDEA